MRKFLPGMFKTHLYEFRTWLTCCEVSFTPGQTVGPKTNVHLRNNLPWADHVAKRFLLSISETWVRCLLFPLLPDVCLLRRRLLCFLWRFKVCPAFMATAGGCVRVLSVTAGVCSTGSKSKVSNSIPSSCLRKEESSEVGLLSKVSPSVTSSPWVLKFFSFIRAVERDQGFWDSQLVEEELL